MVVTSVPLMHASSYCNSNVEIDAEALASVSDYGSEFDATELNETTLLASTLDSPTQELPRSADKASVLPSIEFEEGEGEDEDRDDVVTQKSSLLRMSKRHQRSNQTPHTRRDLQSSPIRATLEVEYDEQSRRAWSGASRLRQPNDLVD